MFTGCPSMYSALSLPNDPPTWKLPQLNGFSPTCEPPAPPCAIAAGERVMRLKTLRPFKGVSLVLRSSMTWPRDALSVCSSGVSAVTFTVWLTAPTSIRASMRTLCCTCTTMGSRVKCLKPGFSTSMRYSPGVKLTKEYNPSWPVVNVSFALVAVLVSVTCASGTAAPDASETVPEIDPKVDWPRAVKQDPRNSTVARIERQHLYETTYASLKFCKHNGRCRTTCILVRL